MAIDLAGNLYVSDNLNATIRKITAGGVVTTFAGTALTSGMADGTGSAARFDSPSGIAIDSVGNLYVTDTGNYTVRKITPAAVVKTVVGAPLLSGVKTKSLLAALGEETIGVAIGPDRLYIGSENSVLWCRKP